MRVPGRIAIIAASLLLATRAHAAYPDKPVRFIVAFPPGGNADLMARLVAQRLGEALGKPFVIDNRGGAAGMIAEEVTARSLPDGYTILLVSLAHVVNPRLNSKLSYDPVKDLAPVSLVAAVPNVLIVHNSVPVKSVPELIALAKAKPGELTYAASLGTSLFIAGALFTSMAKVNIREITYKSGAGAIPDIEAGRVHMVFSVITTALTALKSGRVQALAVTSAKRSQVMPELPAMAEFLPGYQVLGWQGILVPAKTPPAIVAKLSETIAAAMRSPEVQSRMISLGADAIGSTPQEFANFRHEEFARIGKVMAQAGIKPEY